ncbi:NAD(P)(+) transhydrogenase (Re/Si-specific) subunit beta [Sphingobium vermicomposti]|uniref:NAD(P) transhydrogenase subunit beta n=1 Tax=Sphingobium vermicomposti TaxID=529005 RepID=A0A846M2G5_9SPHN|nr:NAD(P)(+) transhydrogenase (Re/Si-specific) subunit beta [Sphingobium vermicomposti]NIJ15258.1 NAD(P) transhydrogenase subunit beta [Sphingobium vermicomposti]
MSGGVDAVLVAWALSSLLFVLSLWKYEAEASQRRLHAAGVGVLLLAAAGIYSADIVNLPEIAGTLLIGASLGLVLARGWRPQALPTLLTAFCGAIGLSMLCAALAAYLNPNAFGIMPARGDGVTGGALLLVGVTAATGALAWVVAMVAMFAGRGGPGDQARRIRLLAMAGGLAGCSVTALAFLLQHAGLVVAGGLAGTSGLVLWARLRWGAGGKGLAPARRRA